MNTPHKHAEVIKAWADGAEIEIQVPGKDDWIPVTWSPAWDGGEYRVKPQPHKWQKEIDAWASGKTVQSRAIGKGEAWIDWRCKPPNQFVPYSSDFATIGLEWRIKPEKVEVYGIILTPTLTEGPLANTEYFTLGGECYTKKKGGQDNLKLTFEDGRLVAAEVLK